MTILRIGMAALALIFPCSAVGQTTFYASGDGALVCDSPKPLKDYKPVFKDTEARGRYLSSEAVANCQLVPKNRTVEPFDPTAAFVSPTEVVRLHEKGDRKSWYTLKGEWVAISPQELAALAQTIRTCIHSNWHKLAPVPDAPPGMVIKVRLRLNPDGRLAQNPEVMNVTDDPVFRSISDKAIKATQACEPFKLPKEKHEMWKDIVLNFDPREAKKR
jgi:hypothetical protein